MLIRQMSGDSVFHGSPHTIAAAHRTLNASAAFPTTRSVGKFVSEIRSFWHDAVTFEAGVTEISLHYVVFLTFLPGGKISDVPAFVFAQMRGNFKK